MTVQPRFSLRAISIAVLVVALGVLLAPHRALAAAGVPQAPTPVYQEGFENGALTTPTILTGYTGATGMTYTAAAPWLTGCNGVVLAAAALNSAQGLSGCAQGLDYGLVREMAYALGVHSGAAVPTLNHSVSAMTENNPGANLVEFETNGTIPLSPGSRFLTFSVDATDANCVAPPQYKFYLLDGATAIPTFSAPIDPCTTPGSTPINVPAIGTAPANTFHTGTFASNKAVLFSGSSLGIRLINGEGTGSGNDAAFDNIRVLDATPALDKSFSPAVTNAGTTSRLTFTVTNTTDLGEKDGWSFSDALPAGLSIASPANSATTCPGTTLNVSNVPTSTIGATGNVNLNQASCTVSVDVTSPTAGTFANGPGNVTETGLKPPTASTVHFLAADVSIVKTASPATIVPGTNETYSLAVKNNGPDAATNVRVSDPLPAGLTFVSASGGCTNAAGTVSCTLPSLASGASQTFTVTVHVPSSFDHAADNTATVTSDIPDPTPGNNKSTVHVPTKGEADLAIAKTPSTTSPGPNGQVIYTLVVKNSGPSDASGVTVSDPGAAGLTLQSGTPSQGSCSITAGGVSCAIGSLAVGGSAQVLVAAQVAPGSVPIKNTASIVGNQHDPHPQDNQTAVRVTPSPIPQPVADLAIAKRVDHGAAKVGQRLTYSIVVTNNGPDAAPAVKLTDTFGLSSSIASATTTAGSCAKGSPLTCSLGAIPPRSAVTISVVAAAKASGALRNAVSATHTGIDPTAANNLAHTDTRIAKPALRVLKLASRSTIRAGETVAYTITVSNPSQATLHGTRVCDSLPSGLLYVSSRPRAKLSHGKYCWNAGTLGAGKRKRYALTAQALSGTSGNRTNRVTATSPQARSGHTSRTILVKGSAGSSSGVTG